MAKMTLGGPSVYGKMVQKLILTPRVRKKVKPAEVRKRTVLPKDYGKGRVKKK